MPDERVDRQLVRLLEHESALLRRGQLDRLAGIAATKQRLVAEVSKTAPDPGILGEIGALARRNEGLLEAAGAGLRAAVRRLKALREASGPIRSYGARGQETVIGAQNPNVSRKA